MYKTNGVMTVAALQKRVKQNISSIEDLVVLEKINQLIDETSKVYVLSEDQLEMLKESDEDLKNGYFFTQDEMDEKVKEWMNRR